MAQKCSDPTFSWLVACHAAIMAGEPNVVVIIAVLHAAGTGSNGSFSEMHALGHLPGRGVDVHIGSLLASNAEAKTLGNGDADPQISDIAFIGEIMLIFQI